MISEIIVRLALKQALAFLSTKLPGWVMGGPIGYIISFFLEKIITALVDRTVLGVNFLYIDIKTKKELDEYNKTMEKIAIEIDKGEKSGDEIDEMVIDAARGFFTIG